MDIFLGLDENNQDYLQVISKNMFQSDDQCYSDEE